MEHRTDELSAGEEIAAEQEFRQLLERYHEPSRQATPSNLTTRVMLNIPPRAPGELVRRQRRQHRLRNSALGAATVLFVALFSLGFYGVLFDSGAPATIFSMTGGFSQVVLILTLSAKPLVNLVLTSGLPLLPVLFLLLLGGSWLWHYLLRGSQKPAFDLGS
jgi:hypothetical protein